jgi:hypothetical protein
MWSFDRRFRGQRRVKARCLLRKTLHASTMEGAMTDDRRDEHDVDSKRMESKERQEQSERDDLARRRELTRQAQLTNREREERWPIG